MTSPRILPTLGLRLGFLFSFVLLVLPSLLRVYVAYRLNYGQAALWQRLPFDGWTILLGVMAILFGVITLVAWRGRPYGIFWIYQGVMVLTISIIIFESALRYYADYPKYFLIGNSDDDIFNRIYRYLIIFQVLICFYMLWYINRSPARRFFEQFKE